MRVTPDVARAAPTLARRRRGRRIRSFFRHEQVAIKMAVVSAQHHSAQRCCSIATQTDDYVATSATASLAAIYAATLAPSPVIKHVIPAPAVPHVAPALVIEYVSSAPVIVYMAPAPAVTLSVPSQQSPPAYTTTTDNTDDNFDIADLVHPQFSFTAVEAFSPLVVGSLPPLEEFDAPVYDQIHQEHIVAGEMTQHRVGNPAVQEHVIVQEIPQAPQVVDSSPLLGDVAAREYNQVLLPPVIFRTFQRSGLWLCRDTCRDRFSGR